MKYPSVGSNNFALAGHGIYCIPVLVAKEKETLRKRNTLFLDTYFSLKHLKQSKYKSQQRYLNPQLLSL